MTSTINCSELSKTINQYLKDFEGATEDALYNATQTIAKESAQIVRQEANRYGTKYTSEITHSKPKKSQQSLSSWVYVKGDHYRIAHLLEHGHAMRSGCRRTEPVEGHEHFAKGEEYADKNFIAELKKEIAQ